MSPDDYGAQGEAMAQAAERRSASEYWRQSSLTEEQEQIAFINWLNAKRICYIHVPNGGNRDLITAARLKRMGAAAGVPDILIFTPPPNESGTRGVAIELKRANAGKVSRSQRDWLNKLFNCGWAVQICHGSDEAIRFCESLGY